MKMTPAQWICKEIYMVITYRHGQDGLYPTYRIFQSCYGLLHVHLATCIHKSKFVDI